MVVSVQLSMINQVAQLRPIGTCLYSYRNVGVGICLLCDIIVG